MPIVPPIVSTGAVLVPHIASLSGPAPLLYGCYATFGISLVASLIIITLIWSPLAHHGTSGTALFGTFVTGTTSLALQTSLPAFRYVAVAAWLGLLAAWVTVAVGTAVGSGRGDLFIANPAAGAAPAGKGDLAPAV